MQLVNGGFHLYFGVEMVAKFEFLLRRPVIRTLLPFGRSDPGNPRGWLRHLAAPDLPTSSLTKKRAARAAPAQKTGAWFDLGTTGHTVLCFVDRIVFKFVYAYIYIYVCRDQSYYPAARSLYKLV